MGDVNSIKYNLTALLRLKDFDLRKLAKKNPLLTVEEYYNRLSNFIKNVPMAADTLNRVINDEATSNDHWSLAFIKTMLEDIACRKFSSVINETIRASKMGHHQFAADHAKKILEKINVFKIKITAAQITEIITDDLNPDEKNKENAAAENLSTALLLLDHEEATRKLKILVVDDAPVMLKTVSAVLENDYKVYGMTNPAMIEKFLHQITPELFLLDYKMPELSGFDLVPIIRSFEEHKVTPIIFLTAMGTIDNVSAAFALGAVDFMVKPFQGAVLREKIAKHIVRKRLY